MCKYLSVCVQVHVYMYSFDARDQCCPYLLNLHEDIDAMRVHACTSPSDECDQYCSKKCGKARSKQWST
jgi:hypothetical protein